ncbi:MAG: hemin ABC transporter substrate-binding protein [Thiohalocapsa sp.]|nr:hemin ABC transporter substrate-binding protein [Thiohalocapsa sp.]
MKGQRTGKPARHALALVWLSVLGLSMPAASAPASADGGAPSARLVSVDGAITEIVYALGAEDRLVGVDTTSKYPPAAEALASVGYKRSLSAEGVLSLQPDLVLATDDAGPPEVLRQIDAAGVQVEQVPDEPTIEGLHSKIDTVARLLGRASEGKALRGRIDAELDRLSRQIRPAGDPPRVLFLLHTGAGNDLAAGRDSVADTVIRLAGGENVLHDAFSGYKPLGPEAALVGAPQVILVTKRNLDGLGGIDGLLRHASLSATPAGSARRVVAMDGPLLLAFGPRLATAVAELAAHLGTAP